MTDNKGWGEMRRLFSLAVLMAFFVSLLPSSALGFRAPTNDQQTAIQTDAELAAATAVLLSEFEATGDFHSLYDWIHPDAHAVVSRAAVVGWFQNEYFPRGPGVATVTDVRFVSWTWEVTGQTYPYTAEVSFTQPFYNDGQTVSDVVRLVPFDGTFRWFFGRSAEFVSDVNTRYGLPHIPAPSPGATLDSYAGFVMGDLDAFWRQVMSSSGFMYRSPSFAFTASIAFTACGAIETDAMYCSADETIYIDSRFATDLLVNAEFALAYVLAHEFAHHVQHQSGGLGSQALSRSIELQADCLAGVWSQDIDTRGMLEANDTSEVLLLIDVMGNGSMYSHGTVAQRTAAYLAGFYGGLYGCANLSL